MCGRKSCFGSDLLLFVCDRAKMETHCAELILDSNRPCGLHCGYHDDEMPKHDCAGPDGLYSSFFKDIAKL